MIDGVAMFSELCNGSLLYGEVRGAGSFICAAQAEELVDMSTTPSLSDEELGRSLVHFISV